jgi:microcystin degradation protein MlrC
MNHDKDKAGRIPRIAILGIHLEANGFAPPTVRADFTSQCWEEGEAITRLARQESSHLPSEVPAFYAPMDATGAWTPVPLIMLAAQPGGPIEQPLFDNFMQRAEDGLHAALPLEGVYVSSHGGSSATADEDNDGTLLAMVRRVVGPGVPVIVTHDLHCNVSERLVDAVDALIASHIDLGWCDNYKKYLFNFAKHRRPEHYGLIVERAGLGASISRKKTP